MHLSSHSLLDLLDCQRFTPFGAVCIDFNFTSFSWESQFAFTAALAKPRNLGPFILGLEASGLGELGVALVEEGEL